MSKIRETVEKYALKPLKYQIKGKVTIIDTDNGRFALKEKNRNNNQSIFEYLNSRNFHYYPEIVSTDRDDYEITEYQEMVDMPDDQKMMDMIDLVALLHSKTTYFEEVDIDDYKKLYEDISNNIAYLTSYYNDYISVFETKVFMSPSEYLFARNISAIYSALYFAKQELEKWYEMIQEKRKQRHVVLHNNLDLSHFIRNERSYLVSWDKAKIDLPIFDLYKLYKRHGLDFDFSEILKRYERTYPLLEEERKLLFILIALPDKIEFDGPEYQMCQIISREFDLLFKTEQLISPYYSKERK